MEQLTAEELTELAGMTPEEEQCVVGKCPYCGELRNDLLPTMLGDADLRCAECDSRHHYCTICSEEHPDDGLCRHLFHDHWYGTWEVLGAGSAADGGWLRDIRHGIFALSAEISFPHALHNALRSGEFYMFLCGPMIGAPDLEVHGLQIDGQTVFRGCRYGQEIMDAMEVDLDRDPDRKINLAAHWLLSLYKTDTTEATAWTADMVAQWLASQTSRLIVAAPAA